MERSRILLALLALFSVVIAVNEAAADYPGAVPPPPGKTANLEHPPDVGRRANLIAISVCYAVATLLFFVRVYYRIVIVRDILLEDGMYTFHCDYVVPC